MVSSVGAATLLDNGGVVIADNGAGGLLFSDGSGGWRLVGRKGRGPGEFDGIRAVYTCAGDTLVVRSGISTVSVFSGDGKFARSIAAGTMRGASYGVSPDCAALLIGVPVPSSSGLADSLDLSWFEMKTSSLVRVARVPSDERELVSFAGEREPMVRPFGRRTYVATTMYLVFVGVSDTPAIQVFDRAGHQVREIRWAATRRPFDRDVAQRFERTRLELDRRVAAGASTRVPTLSIFSPPEYLPFFARIIAAGDGRLWVQQYPDTWERFEQSYGPDFQEGAARWWVLNPDGSLQAVFATPPKVSVRVIRANRLLEVRAAGNGGLAIQTREMPPRQDAPTR